MTAANDAMADKRVALVLGNSAYSRVPRLANPVNDAGAVADLLRSAGFDIVESHHDLDVNQIRRVVRDFSDIVRDADIAVVFYAGHGIEVDGTNYLVPVDAQLSRDVDVEDETISLDRILRILEGARRLRLVILDACRDNPFTRTMKRTIATRTIGRGLAPVEPTSSDTLIAFAAKAGSTAADGDDRHSPFTSAMLKHIAQPGLDLRIAFGHVRDDVLNSTRRKQEPFVYGSLGGGTVSLVPLPAPEFAEPRPVAPAHRAADIRRDYELAERIGTIEAWDTFLTGHGAGFYADLAKAARAKLVASEQSRRDEDELARLRTAEDTRRKAEQASLDPPAVVAFAPTSAASSPAPRTAVPTMELGDITRLLQAHLRRVGCDPGNTDGNWSDGSRRALEQFNQRAGTRLDVKVASLDALDAVRSRNSRVCPLVCGKGYRAEGEACVAIACKRGFVRDADGDCVRKESPGTAARSSATARGAEPSTPAPQTEAGRPAAASKSGQTYCGSLGCVNIPKNCAVAVQGGISRILSGGVQVNCR